MAQAELTTARAERPQADETTCGPTCLHAVFRYFGEDWSVSFELL